MLINPKRPSQFDNTSNDERSPTELATYWDVPFAITSADGSYEVRCLDGGCWDRATCYGYAPDLASAEALAARKL